jgi:4-hydroxy-tetrahydrodipicolinate synthase
MAHNPGSFPVVTKGYMPLLGFEVGEPIRPNHRCTPENLAQLQQLLDSVGARKLA